MQNFKFDEDKAIAIFLYVASKLHEGIRKADLHKIFKIIYFADQKHLAKYGRPVLMGDSYIAMKDGPVPSKLYDITKIVRGDGLSCAECRDYAQYFSVTNHYVTPLLNAELDELSSSDIQSLDESFAENKGLTFSQIRIKSHDAAWDSACKDSRIHLREIAKAAGLEPGMLKYLSAKLEAEAAFR